MKLGSNLTIIFILSFFFNLLKAEQEITTTSLVNVDKIKPSFENLDEKNNQETISKLGIKEKERIIDLQSSQAILIGLDKITAKSSEIIVKLNEKKKFGPLEIKLLKCDRVKILNKIDSVAYMQVKDLTKNENEQVFIFNGWTFASDPSLVPFDHAIYDLKLINCRNT